MGYYQPIFQHPFCYCESLVHIFLLFNHYFYKKLNLYVHIPNMYLRLGFEFGSQGSRDLAFVCPQSVHLVYIYYFVGAGKSCVPLTLNFISVAMFEFCKLAYAKIRLFQLDQVSKYSVCHIITYPSKELYSKMALGEVEVSLP